VIKVCLNFELRMKTKAVISFLFLILSQILIGQTKTYIGIRAGGHLKSAFLDHTIFNYAFGGSFSPGINTGLFIKHFPKKRDIFFNSGIQLGINYSQKGWEQNFDLESQEARDLPKYRVSMNYIEIPIEGIGYFGNKNKYFIAGGLLVEFLINHSKDEVPPFDSEITDIASNVNRINLWNFATFEEERDSKFGYGARISGGMFRDFSFGSIHLEGYFTYSFSNFIDSGDLTDPNLPDISNLWTAGASIGFLIPFGKLEMLNK